MKWSDRELFIILFYLFFFSCRSALFENCRATISWNKMQEEGRVRFLGGNRFIRFSQHRNKNFLWALIKGIYLLGG